MKQKAQVCQSRPYAANSINPLKTHWQLMMHIETPLPVVSRTGPHTSGRAHHCPISHFIHTSVFSGHHSSQMTQQCVMQLVCFTPLTCLQFHTLCYSTFSYKNSFQQMLVSAWWRKCIHYLFWFSFLSILSSHLFYFSSCCSFLSLRCEELPEGSSGQHHHSSCWGTKSLYTMNITIWSFLSNPPLTRCVSASSVFSFMCLRSLQSLRTWFLGFCLELLSQLQTRCVALCSVCPPSAKTERCRYSLTRTQSSFSLIVRPWLISRPPHL